MKVTYDDFLFGVLKFLKEGTEKHKKHFLKFMKAKKAVFDLIAQIQNTDPELRDSTLDISNVFRLKIKERTGKK